MSDIHVFPVGPLMQQAMLGRALAPVVYAVYIGCPYDTPLAYTDIVERTIAGKAYHIVLFNCSAVNIDWGKVERRLLEETEGRA